MTRICAKTNNQPNNNMGKMIKLNMNLGKVPGVEIRKNSAGVTFANVSGLREDKKGNIWLDVVVFENDKPDQYDNDYAVKADQSREDREAGKQAPYIGNGRNLGGRPQQRQQQQSGPANRPANEGDDDIPF